MKIQKSRLFQPAFFTSSVDNSLLGIGYSILKYLFPTTLHSSPAAWFLLPSAVFPCFSVFRLRPITFVPNIFMFARMPLPMSLYPNGVWIRLHDYYFCLFHRWSLLYVNYFRCAGSQNKYYKCQYYKFWKSLHCSSLSFRLRSE